MLCSDTERSQIAYVTFKDLQGAETAVLLSVTELLLLSLCPFLLLLSWSFTVHCSAVILYYFIASLNFILFIGSSSSVIHTRSKFNLDFYKEDSAGWGGENKMENSPSFLNTIVELMDQKEVMS